MGTSKSSFSGETSGGWWSPITMTSASPAALQILLDDAQIVDDAALVACPKARGQRPHVHLARALA